MTPIMHPPLHSSNCSGSKEDLVRMATLISNDPSCIETLQPASSYFSDETFALHEASRLGHVECVRLLLNSGARPDVLDCRLFTPILHALAYKKHHSERSAIISLLLEHGALLHYSQNTRNLTRYLEQAVLTHQNEALRNLLEREAFTMDFIPTGSGEVQCRTNFDPPVCVAIQSKNTAAFSLLLFHNAPIKFYDFHNHIVSLPHRIVECYFRIELLKEIFAIYYQYGGSMWTTFHDQTALQAVRMPENGYFFDHSIAEVEKILIHYMSTPRSLQSICRTVIKQAVGRTYWRDVFSLPLPSQIISYLLFPDCEASQHPSILED